jgi:heat shock protein HslJ
MIAASALASTNLIQVDMHPSTSYIQWLLHQQQSMTNASRDDNNNSHRRRRKLKIIEEQLQRAMEHIEGTSAVYAPFFEFPLPLIEGEPIINNDNLHHNNVDNNDDHHHRRLIKQYLQRHNDAVQEYNERYRQFSRYERALQNEQSLSSSFDKINTTITTATATTTTSRLDPQSSILSSLHGTKWQATELYIASNNHKATSNYQLQAPLVNHHPITLEFDATDDNNNIQPQNYIITGSTSGCNRYIGSIYQTIDTNTLVNSFYIGDIVATTVNATVTDAKCTIAVAKSFIEQEQSYMKLLSNRQIYVEVMMNNNATADELVFWNYDSVAVKNEDVRLQQEDELAYYHRHGRMLARFKLLSDSLLKDNDQSSTSSSVHRRRIIRQRSLQETVISKKKGGMFNSYQTSPLHQGYGTHYATIWVGTPPQRKSVIIDTGSHFTAFPCKGCLGCGEEHHTDKYFDQDASSTFRPLQCKAVPNRPKECQGIANCLNGKCILSQTYTEGSSWEAFQAVDKLFVGGKQLTNTALSGDSYGKRKRQI